MKHTFKILLLMFGLAFLHTQCEKEAAIDIPDKAFLNALIELGIDTNGDGIISSAEAAVVTSLNVRGDFRGDNISDMTGIENFVNLEILNCGWNQLTTLDISNNTSLEQLSCVDNQLTTLDISNNTGLIELGCGFNQLTSLDISNNTGLIGFSCSFNQLTSLDVSNNTSLEILYCDNNQLTNIDVSNNAALWKLVCNYNQLTSLDVSNNVALEMLDCDNNQLLSLDLSNNSNLGKGFVWGCHLDISDIPTLEEVCVWTMPFPPEELELCMDGSPNVYFTTECSK